ncbi:MAG: hypothetical protein ACM3PS_04060 [Syntrophothermus sp.]
MVTRGVAWCRVVTVALSSHKPVSLRRIESLREEIDGLVFREIPDGSIVVSKVPTRKKKTATPAQKAYRHGTFPDRVQWARMAQHEYPIYAELAAHLPMVTAYNLAIKDIAHPPVIYRILRQDGRILVHATDEILVAGVRVLVHDAQGQLLEAGDAQQTQKDWWEYIPQFEGRVSAIAWDLPGNKARIELDE